jgi:hypothetical protein
VASGGREDEFVRSGYRERQGEDAQHGGDFFAALAEEMAERSGRPPPDTTGSDGCKCDRQQAGT